MPTIEEQRNKAIAEQIRKMAGMGPEEDDTPSQPVSEKRREKKQETQPATSPQTDYESYQKLFLNPCTIENRVSFKSPMPPTIGKITIKSTIPDNSWRMLITTSVSSMALP